MRSSEANTAAEWNTLRRNTERTDLTGARKSMEKKYRYGSSLTQQRIEGYLFEKIRKELNDSTLIRSRNVVFL